MLSLAATKFFSWFSCSLFLLLEELLPGAGEAATLWAAIGRVLARETVVGSLVVGDVPRVAAARHEGRGSEDLREGGMGDGAAAGLAVDAAAGGAHQVVRVTLQRGNQQTRSRLGSKE